MAFVRRRTTGRGGLFSHQVIESYRRDGRVRQRVLANLGPYPDVASALEGWRDEVVRSEQRLVVARARQTRRRDRMVLLEEHDLDRYRTLLARLQTAIAAYPQLNAERRSANPSPQLKEVVRLRRPER
jgi:hypothetical protein